MATDIDRNEVQRFVADGAQLVEVLPAKEYRMEHIPDAVSIPVQHLDRQTARQLDADRPVIVYCYDYQ